MQPADIKRLKGWIGRTAEAMDDITPRLIEEYKATLAPYLAPVDADRAPLGLHWCLAPAICPLAELGPDGHPAQGQFVPPAGLPRRMWAGGEVEFLMPLKAGDRVVRTSHVTDVVPKRGRSGRLCFVIFVYEFSTPRGTAIRERQNIVYREAVGTAAAPESAAAQAPVRPPAGLSWSIEASPVLLFRYSALTFNSHRIHYDYPYVTGVEGYPGLIVHGPLQATLLLNLAAFMGGHAPERIRFRGLAPLIAGEVFKVSGSRAEGRIACWTESAAGRIGMEAEAAA